jgi:siroheme decarboxylase
MHERRLLALLQQGLPIVAEPYALLATELGIAAGQVPLMISDLEHRGYIQRFGVIVNHRKVGYNANAMVVWNVPDERVSQLAAQLAAQPQVTLCYRRERRPPAWPYNLYTMIHGRRRETVIEQIQALRAQCGAEDIDHAVLFSRKAFKQRGGRYVATQESGRG